MTGEIKTVKTIIHSECNPKNGEGAFLRLADGGILYAYTKYNSNGSSIVAIRSYDDGDSWSEPAEIISRDTHNASVSSVSLLRMQNGDIGIFYMVETTPGWVHHLVLARSSDEGVTFSKEVANCSFELYDGYHMLSNDSVIRLSSGRIIVPITYHTGNQKDTEGAHVDTCAYAGFSFSDDDGVTWHSSTDEIYQTFSNTKSGLQHGVVVEIAPKSLKAFWTTDMMCAYESYSTDDGNRWMAAQPARFSAPCSPINITKNPANGKIYAVWNPMPNYNGRAQDCVTLGRTPLVWAELDSSALVIKDIHVIENDESKGYTSPSVFFCESGNMLVAYSCGGKDEGSCMADLKIVKIEL